jgi:hypothetical protein
MGREYSTHGRREYGILIGNPEGKRPLGSPVNRWEDNITMDHRDIGWGCRLDSSDSG